MRFRWPAALLMLLTLLTAGCPQAPVNIEPETLSNAVEGQHYAVNLGIGTDAPQRWSVVAGALPPGLAISADDGVLSGTPTAAGDFQFTVQATNLSVLGGASGQRTYDLHVIPKLQIAGTLPSARVNEPYSQTVQVSGGVPPYQINVIGLPAGLSFDPATATIAGTPLLASTGLRVDITAHDSGTPQQSAAVVTQLVIRAEPVAIVTSELPSGRVNQSYSAQLQAEKGLAPYTWGFLTTVPGTLPDGLTLNPNTGVISGIPTTPGISTFTIRVTDSEMPPNSDTRELSIEISP